MTLIFKLSTCSRFHSSTRLYPKARVGPMMGQQSHLVFPGLAPLNTRTGDCFVLSTMAQ
jgi:hypothetical protein